MEQRLAIDGQGLVFRYGREAVLDGLNIAVRTGVIYGLLGPSGCGKTTLLRCIVGRNQPCKGTIRIHGQTPGSPGCTVPGPGVGYMPQELALYPEITTSETLMYFGRLFLMTPKQIKERIAFLTRLLDIPDKNKQIKYLSGGQQRRVSFAAALIHKPSLIILDEPTVGVDPLLRQSIWDHLQTLADVESISIIITTHYVEEARQAHVVGMMRDGRLLAQMNPDLLMEQHNSRTLEEVFRKLCARDEAVEGEEPSSDTRKLVWIPLKAISYSSLSPPKSSDCQPSDEAPSPRVQYRAGGCAEGLRASSDRMAALILKNTVRLKRSLPFVFFQVFIPVFQVIIFCLCVGGEPFDLPLAVVNLETDPAGKSSNFLQHISSYTIQQINYTNFSLALESVKRGENWGVLYIGPKFTDATIDRYLQGTNADNETIRDSTISLYLDTTNQQIAITIFSKIMLSFKSFAEKVLEAFYYNPEIATPPIILEDPIYGDKDPNFTEFMAPGMILGISYIMAVGVSAMSIIIEKKEGLLDRSWVAGVRSWEVVFSMLFVLFVVMLLQVALVLLFTFLAFNLPCRGPLVWAVVAVLLVGLEGMTYGLFISSIVNDENVAMMIAMGSFYPNLLLSGIIWPVEAMPHVLRYLSYCLPMTLIADSMRSILSRGWGLLEHGVWIGFLVTLAWIFPVIIVSSLFFRYKK